MPNLNQILTSALQFSGPDIYKNHVPEFLLSNLRSSFGKREYQQEAFGRFIYYLEDYYSRPKGVPTQLLFHMATGSGKTLIMAGLIIYLYQKGYRNFLFFVNSTNIIEKTRENFLNPASSKYLFADSVSIGDKKIRIKEVDNFQAANQDDINIVFSTIQALHIRLNTPKENSVTYEDFEDQKIVMISDEAHHINTETKNTKKLNVEERELIVSWERTVNRIFNANKDNIMLEFTATVDLSIPEIAEKYQDKLIFDYPLKQFRKDGYSKDVKVLQADLAPFDRALQGVLLSQYRRKIFENYKKRIKPVILFKSKTIKESETFFEEFKDRVNSLRPKDLSKIKNTTEEQTFKRMFRYFEDNHISFENLITELKEDFSENKLISVNSKDDSEQKQIAVNTLEDENNEYRAVFAVDKLNEGWDVLNLFDIVRLYDTRDAKAGKPGKTTMSEAQLIGRGARYCPFQITPDQPLYMRKYDENLDHDLRICEELYYHSAYNPRYIQELNKALEEIGIKATETIERDLILKDNFVQSSFFDREYLFLNEQKKYNREDVFSLDKELIDQIHKISLKTGFSKSSVVFAQPEEMTVEKSNELFQLIDFGEIIVRKAINKLDFYQFSNLKKYLPHLKSITEFITSPNYLGKVQIEISALPDQIKNLTPDDKLQAAISVLENISSQITSDNIEYKGSKEFIPYPLKQKIHNKKVNFALSDSDDKEFGKSMVSVLETNYPLDLSTKDWYVFNDCFGTSEEKLLVHYINKVYENLKEKYSQIYLIRNERHFKLFNFEDGRAIEPDFVLYLIKENPQEKMHYQIFIEPKGQHLLETDKWKEDFLKSLRKEHKLHPLFQDQTYTIWGLPFYNETLNKSEFDQEFNIIIQDPSTE